MNCIKYLFISFLITLAVVSSAQQGLATGYFTSEAKALSLNDDIIVSIKKYNPSQAEIDNASRPSPNTPMNYLMAPFAATNISLYDKAFESGLYCLSRDGQVKWRQTLGFSNKSVPSPVKQYKGFLYAGEATKDKDQVIIRKIDASGKTIWETKLDSLHNVNDIYVENDQVSLLVSFDAFERQQGNGNTWEKVYPIYFFVQLDTARGKKLKQDYQQMGNYLSSIGFGKPFINTGFSYYLSNKDSAIFVNASKQASASLVTENMSKANKIREFAAGTESYHLLTVLQAGNKLSYNLISDFYGLKKKYESVIPAPYAEMNRAFIAKNQGDSILTVISTPAENTVYYTDTAGKTTLYGTISNGALTTIAAGEIRRQVFLVQVEGRTKPGVTGKLKISFK